MTPWCSVSDMWARALALVAATVLLAKCIPSGDLASYSNGAGEGTPEADDVLEELPEGSGTGGTGGAGSNVASGEGASSSEAGAMPNVLQGGTSGSSAPGSVGPEPDPGAPMPGTGGSAADPPTEPPTAPTGEPEPGPPQFRFVRLVADSEPAAGPLTSMAEFNVLDAEGVALDRASWVVTADSEELVWVGGAQAEYAIDGAPDTMWHTPWFEVVPPPHPHFFEVDLGQAHSIGGFRYLPRQDGGLEGNIADYRFYVSVDGVEWGEPVLEGAFAPSALEHEARLVP